MENNCNACQLQPVREKNGIWRVNQEIQLTQTVKLQKILLFCCHNNLTMKRQPCSQALSSKTKREPGDEANEVQALLGSNRNKNYCVTQGKGYRVVGQTGFLVSLFIPLPSIIKCGQAGKSWPQTQLGCITQVLQLIRLQNYFWEICRMYSLS